MSRRVDGKSVTRGDAGRGGSAVKQASVRQTTGRHADKGEVIKMLYEDIKKKNEEIRRREIELQASKSKIMEGGRQFSPSPARNVSEKLRKKKKSFIKEVISKVNPELKVSMIESKRIDKTPNHIKYRPKTAVTTPVKRPLEPMSAKSDIKTKENSKDESKKVKELILSSKERVRPKSQYNSSSVEKTSVRLNPTPRSDRRYISDNQAIYNAYNLLSSSLVAPRMKILVSVGSGNNDELVSKLLSMTSMVEPTRFARGSHLVWTQHCMTQSDTTKTYNVCKAGMDALQSHPYFSANHHNLSAAWLSEELIKIRLFRASATMVNQSFSRMFKSNRVASISGESISIMNHIKGMGHISIKSRLASTMTDYGKKTGKQAFDIMPATTVTQRSAMDNISLPQSISNVFVVKRGENSNRGRGVVMAYSDVEAIEIAKKMFEDERCKTVVVQSYIHNPLLFKGRKFDLRCYALVVKLFGKASVFFYRLGYMRTSSFDFSLDSKDNPMVHLTNEAIQVLEKSTFGKYEPGNKIYYNEAIDHYDNTSTFTDKNIKFDNLIDKIKVSIR